MVKVIRTLLGALIFATASSIVFLVIMPEINSTIIFCGSFVFGAILVFIMEM